MTRSPGRVLRLPRAMRISYSSIGIEKDRDYFLIGREAIPKLTAYSVNGADETGTPNSRATS